MASDAPLIGHNAPLKSHHLAFNIFGALSTSSHCVLIKECALQKSDISVLWMQTCIQSFAKNRNSF